MANSILRSTNLLDHIKLLSRWLIRRGFMLKLLKMFIITAVIWKICLSLFNGMPNKLYNKPQPIVVIYKSDTNKSNYMVSCYNLNKKLSRLNQIRTKWIQNRIKSYCEEWIGKSREINGENYRNNDKILIVIGVLVLEESMGFGKNAFRGGPLGELVQWSDTITSLYLLGYKITIIVERRDISIYRDSYDQLNEYKLIFIDYLGVNILHQEIPQTKKDVNIRCKLRIVDSFGTEAPFNSGKQHFDYPVMKINLKQYFTMFPHSPDNSFLGFVIRDEQKKIYSDKKNIAVVYAKDENFIQRYNANNYIEFISKYFDIHFTFHSTKQSNHTYHGVMNPVEYYKLLDSAKLFVGVGFPYEGPAPLEAINRGCVFLNPSIDPPINRDNSGFWSGKPTARFIKSQNPYCKEYIGEPYVYTISMNDESSLQKILLMVKNMPKFPSYMPYEFSYKGMLERIKFYIEKQDFCGKKESPMKKKLIVVLGERYQDCKSTCNSQKLICEHDFFNILNSRVKSDDCSMIDTVFMFTLPAKISLNGKILACQQTDPLFYSCTGKSLNTERFCPCRKYTKGNIYAL